MVCTQPPKIEISAMQKCLMCEEKCDSALVYYARKEHKRKGMIIVGGVTVSGPQVYPFHDGCFEEAAGIIFDLKKDCQLCSEELQDIFSIFRTSTDQGKFFYFHKH